jgi:hypothetical protein
MRLTKTLVAASLAAVLASQAVAGGFSPVVVEPQEPLVVVEPEPQRSSLGILLPLALLGGLVALAVAADKS